MHSCAASLSSAKWQEFYFASTVSVKLSWHARTDGFMVKVQKTEAGFKSTLVVQHDIISESFFQHIYVQNVQKQENK